MSTPTASADSSATTQLVQEAHAVSVVYADQDIGSGQLTMTPDGIRVEGRYEWPIDAPALVWFSFTFDILTENACRVEVRWPDLLRGQIPLQDARYHRVSFRARPDFLISTPAGDRVTAEFVGPMGRPELANGLQVSVALAGGSSSASLLFRYQLDS
jgi:hypothetical protein